MVRIDIDMPHDCYTCWIRQNMGCKIANASGWLNSRRDEDCPLLDDNIVTCDKCKYGSKEDFCEGRRWCWKHYDYVVDRRGCIYGERGVFNYDEWCKIRDAAGERKEKADDD